MAWFHPDPFVNKTLGGRSPLDRPSAQVPNVDLGLEDFELDVVGSKSLDADIRESITTGTYTLSMEQAHEVDVGIEDPDLSFLRSETLTRWAWGDNTLDEAAWISKGQEVDSTLDGRPFRLVRVEKVATNLKNIFEAREVSILRRVKGAKQAPRSKMTRAEFAYSLVKPTGVEFYAPELHAKQPIATSKDNSGTSSGDRITSGRKGIAPHTKLTVKGKQITERQRKDIEKTLDVADSLNAPERAVLAMVVAAIGESGYDRKAVEHVYGTHKGIFQSDVIPPDDVEGQAHWFLVGGHSFRAGGAISAVRQNPEWSVGLVAAKVEVSDGQESYYQGFLDEAKAIMNAYYGAGGREGLRRKAYVFERKPGETTWDCLQRLASEVNWRCFTRDGKVWFVSEEWLFAQRSVFKICERRAADVAENVNQTKSGASIVDAIDFQIDVFARNVVAEITVTCDADRWSAIPGMVVEVEGSGPADGRWLVSQVDGDLFDPVVTITLRKPIKPKPEPAAQLVNVSNVDGSTAKGNLSKSSTLVGHPEVKPKVARIVNTILDQWPKLQITATTNGNHVSGSFHYKGEAVDLASSDQAYMDKAARWIARELTPLLTEGIHNPGLAVKHGQSVDGPTFYASVWAGHRDHIHVAREE